MVDALEFHLTANMKVRISIKFHADGTPSVMVKNRRKWRWNLQDQRGSCRY